MVLDVNGPRRVPRAVKSDRARHDLAGDAATVDARNSIKVERSISIDASPGELYAVWRDFRNLPRFMKYVKAVEVEGNRSRWTAGMRGRSVEWESEIVNDLPDELIAWKTVADSNVAHAGSVHFEAAADGRTTVVRLVMDYEPPGGKPGHFVSRLLGVSPSVLIADDLRRFKRMIEAGRRSGGRPSADDARRSR